MTLTEKLDAIESVAIVRGFFHARAGWAMQFIEFDVWDAWQEKYETHQAKLFVFAHFEKMSETKERLPTPHFEQPMPEPFIIRYYPSLEAAIDAEYERVVVNKEPVRR